MSFFSITFIANFKFTLSCFSDCHPVFQRLYGGRNLVQCICVPEGFPGGASGKEPTCQCRRHKRPRFSPWVRKILWRSVWQPTPDPCLENPSDGGAWRAMAHRVAKSRTWLKQLSTSAQYLIYNQNTHICTVRTHSFCLCLVDIM